MAKPSKDAKSGDFFVSFSFKGKRHKRSTGSASLSDARAGLLSVPDGVEVADFVFDGKTAPTGSHDNDSLTVEDFIRGYLEEAAPPNKAESTHTTEKVHLGHLAEFEGKRNVRRMRQPQGSA